MGEVVATPPQVPQAVAEVVATPPQVPQVVAEEAPLRTVEVVPQATEEAAPPMSPVASADEAPHPIVEVTAQAADETTPAHSQVADEALQAPQEAAQGARPDEQVESTAPLFELHAQLANTRVELLSFRLDQDVEEIVDAFINNINLNPMFKDPLMGQINLMATTDKRVDQVDVVDLI